MTDKAITGAFRKEAEVAVGNLCRIAGVGPGHPFYEELAADCERGFEALCDVFAKDQGIPVEQVIAQVKAAGTFDMG